MPLGRGIKKPEMYPLVGWRFDESVSGIWDSGCFLVELGRVGCDKGCEEMVDVVDGSWLELVSLVLVKAGFEDDLHPSAVSWML
jgi:hypothetical protein